MRLRKAVGSRDHTLGPVEAPITLVEYGDYQSAACGEAYYVAKDLQKQLGDKLRFVFRHFSLTVINPFANYAALAAEAAGAQGKFWEMHDFLFQNPYAVADNRLFTYAGAIGLDVNRFEREVAGHYHADCLQDDFVSGIISGVNGAPTFFINELRHEGAWNFDALLHAIEAALAANDEVFSRKL